MDCRFGPVVGDKAADRIEPIHGRRVVLWLSPTKYCTVRTGGTRFFARWIVCKQKNLGFFQSGKTLHAQDYKRATKDFA
jgi:hypothetical protein